MSEQIPHVYKVASDDIDVWVDPGGAICLKVRTQYNDPAELSKEEAIELSDLLARLAKEPSK